MHSEPSGQWSGPQPAAYRERPSLGVFVLVGGFATMLFGMFALPVQDPLKGDPSRLSQVYFGTVNQLASLDNSTFPLFGSVARLWWSWLGLLMFGLLAVAVAAAAALPVARRLLGWVSVLLAVAAAALYTVALRQTGDIVRLAQTFRREGTSFDVAGTGLWVGYVGLGVLLLGGILTALIRSRPPATAPATAPAGTPGSYPPAGWQSGPQQQWQPDQPAPWQPDQQRQWPDQPPPHQPPPHQPPPSQPPQWQDQPPPHQPPQHHAPPPGSNP